MSKPHPPNETDLTAFPRRTPWAVLTSMRFALVLVTLLVAACITGTVVPQGDDVAAYLHEHPDAANRLGWMQFLGLTKVFESTWFFGLLGVLALSLITCGASQIRSLFRKRATSQGRTLSSLLIHVSLVAILAGGLIRGVWGLKGSIQLHEGESTSAFESASGIVPFPFAVRLDKFVIETDVTRPVTSPDLENRSERLILRWAHTGQTSSLPATVGVEQRVAPPGMTGAEPYTLKVLRSIPDFMMDPVTRVVETRSAQPRNPAIQVAVIGRNYASTNWFFAKYPEMSMPMRQMKEAPFRIVYEKSRQGAASGPVRNYRSTLEISEEGRMVKTASLAVNSPLSYRGYTFYQSGYDPRDASWTSLLVVRDPGVPVVFMGFTGLIVGIFLGLYVWPRGPTAAPMKGKK